MSMSIRKASALSAAVLGVLAFSASATAPPASLAPG